MGGRGGSTEGNNYPANIVTQIDGPDDCHSEPDRVDRVLPALRRDAVEPVASGLCAAGDLLQVKVSSSVQMSTRHLDELIGPITVASTSQVVVNSMS